MKRHLIGLALLVLASTSFLAGCAPTIIAGSAAGASLAVDRRSTGAIVDDRTTEFKALQKLADQPFYDKSHVSAICYNGRVLLVGQVPTSQDAQTLVTEIQQIPKVRQVLNELEIGPAISFGTRSNDTLITSKVKSALLTEKDLNSYAIKVVTENGVVFLIGIVTHEEANKATEAARKVGGVKKVTRVFEYTNPTQ